jgi:hypothetical protein
VGEHALLIHRRNQTRPSRRTPGFKAHPPNVVDSFHEPVYSLERIFIRGYISREVLCHSEQDSVDRNVHLLEQFGPALPDRYSKPIVSSRFLAHAGIEGAIQRRSNTSDVCFDPRRVALLLLGGNPDR